MKKVTASMTFLIMLAAAAMLFLIGSGDTSGENRALAKMPQFTGETVFSGEFAAGAEEFVNDRISFRSALIDASQRLMSYKGVKSPAGTVIRAQIDMGTGKKQSSDILVNDGKIMELFEKNDALADKYAEVINAYARAVSGANVYAAVIPTQLEFEDAMYSNLENSQLDAINYIYSRLDGNVKRIDMYGALKPHAEEYIYFKTDHHWTALGAYYGYLALCTATGVNSVDINDFEKNTTEEFDGYLSRFVTDPSINVGEDTFEWYNVDKNGNISYEMRSYKEDGSVHKYKTPVFYTERIDYDFFLGADHPMAIYTNSELTGGKTLLAVSDSFVNALAPWLMKSYKRVVLINPRSYLKSFKDAAEEFAPDDVLIMDYVFAHTFEDYCSMLERLLD